MEQDYEGFRKAMFDCHGRADMTDEQQYRKVIQALVRQVHASTGELPLISPPDFIESDFLSFEQDGLGNIKLIAPKTTMLGVDNP
jgi:hypothetical protein